MTSRIESCTNGCLLIDESSTVPKFDSYSVKFVTFGVV